MSTERDTHFAGFADLTWDEISKLEFWIDTAEDDITGQIKQIITRRAYDLVTHILMHTTPATGSTIRTFRGFSVEEIAKAIPDIDPTEWPVEPDVN